LTAYIGNLNAKESHIKFKKLENNSKENKRKIKTAKWEIEIKNESKRNKIDESNLANITETKR
jgi:hypothetical protein